MLRLMLRCIQKTGWRWYDFAIFKIPRYSAVPLFSTLNTLSSQELIVEKYVVHLCAALRVEVQN